MDGWMVEWMEGRRVRWMGADGEVLMVFCVCQAFRAREDRVSDQSQVEEHHDLPGPGQRHLQTGQNEQLKPGGHVTNPEWE